MLFTLGRALWLLTTTLFWAVAAGLVILAISYGAALTIPAVVPLLIYCLAFLSIVLTTWSSAKIVIRRRRMLLILNSVEKSIRLGMPLPKMIQAAAQSETGVMRARLLALTDHLDRGEPLDQALLYSVPEIPHSVIRLIAAGEQLNCLDHVLNRILRRPSDDPGADPTSLGFYWAYPVILLAVVGLIILLVVPKFESIFRDFNITMPPATYLLLRLLGGSTALAVFIMLLSLIPLGRALAGMFPSFRAVSPFGGVLADQLVWWTPILGTFIADRGMADLCDIVAAGVVGGHPLDDSLRQASIAQSNNVLRYRAIAWAQAVSQGQTMHEAARYARMPRLFTSMLATVRSNDSLIQVLSFLWRYYEYRVSRARAVFQALYIPVIVITMGLLVGTIGMALMQPMAMLSEHIASTIYPGGF
jgi:type IV pilus assembly protein PilC